MCKWTPGRHFCKLSPMPVPMPCPNRKASFSARQTALATRQPPNRAASKTWKDSVSSCWALMSIRKTLPGCSPNGARLAPRAATKSTKRKTRSSTFLLTSVPCSSATLKLTTAPAVKSRALKPTCFRTCACWKTGGEGLPPVFVGGLRRALSHYGVQSLDRSPELEESLLWIYKSHQRVEQQIAPVMAMLERRLRSLQRLAPPAEESLRRLLDQMIAMSNGQFPAVSDLGPRSSLSLL